VGVGIDPKRVSEAHENANNAGVADRVKFLRGNLFGADIHDATVVTLYLRPASTSELAWSRIVLTWGLEAGQGGQPGSAQHLLLGCSRQMTGP
jgi:hypothetical protein